MRQQVGLFIFLLGLFLFLDLYVIYGLISLTDNIRFKYTVIIIYGLLQCAGYFGLYKTLILWQTKPLHRPPHVNFLAGLGFSLFITKLILTSCLLLQDAGRLIIAAGFTIASWLQETNAPVVMPERLDLLTWTAVVIAAVPFLSMLYGITYGKYKFVVEKQTVWFKDLPENFDGFKITHISDIHSGSWDDIDKVANGVKMIKSTTPDIIVFTGDLVNQKKDEINPYIDLFADLSAPHGKYAVLGNHDYYGVPRGADSRRSYWEDFQQKYAQMGFDLILNDQRKINRQGDSIILLGVENWGRGRWFPKYGDLDKALVGCTQDDFFILLSHDPTHWDEKVLPHPQKIHLTLSGHTHGMQFGINHRFLRWSPIKYRYKRWIGWHEVEGQKLYINRGFGFLGFPGRVGMWPEITQIELRRLDGSGSS